MKRIVSLLLIALLAVPAWAQLGGGIYNPSGSSSGGTPSGPAGGDLTGTYPNPTVATNAVTFSKFQQIGSNTIVGNATAGTANAAPLAAPSCSTSGSALNWTSNSGFSCNTSIAATTAGTLTGTLSANQLLGSLTAVAPTGQSVPSCSTSSSALQWTSGTGFACNSSIVASSSTTSTTATNATNTAITDDTSTNATMLPTWVTANTGNLPQKTTSTKLTFNPSTGALSSTSFTGAGTGLTGTASSLTAGNVTTNANLTGAITSSGNAASLGSFSSSALATALTDETGTGVAVFATSPAFVTPNVGAATGTSLNLSGLTISSAVATDASKNLVSVTNTGTGNNVLATSPVLVTPTLGAASATSVAFSSTSGVIGSTTNDSAATGSVGEYVSSEVLNASAVSLTTATPANITSITLPAGDYDIWGTVLFKGGATSVLNYLIGDISATTASITPVNTGAFWENAYNAVTAFNSTPNAILGQSISGTRVSISGSTTYYLNAQAGFTVSTCSAYGIIQARRRR